MVCSGMIRKIILFLIILLMVFPVPFFTLCPPVRDENGIWFGNSKGLLYLDTVRMNQRKSVPYSVAITDICVNGKSVVQSVVGDGGKSEISLEASQKNVYLLLF